jgi:hypothetical protein
VGSEMCIRDRDSVAIGYQAGQNNQRSDSVAIGYQSGQNSQQQSSVAIGTQAGMFNQQSSSIAIGFQAAKTSQAVFSTAIGYLAGTYNQGSASIAIGSSAGFTAQGVQCVAIGFQSGMFGQNSQSVAIGYQCGQTGQRSQSVAIGCLAGSINQSSSAVAIGFSAGQTGQSSQAIAIGFAAGQRGQGASSVAIGYQSAQASQGSGCIAIGFASAIAGQLNNAVPIGNNSGSRPLGVRQGDSSICIGSNSVSTFSNSIVLNASGGDLFTQTSAAFYVKPIRSTGTNIGHVLQCDYLGTNEITVNTNKSFVIDHPTDKARHLVHVCLEGPEAGVYYRGKATIDDDGQATVLLPAYVPALATDFTVQLTPVSNKRPRGQQPNNTNIVEHEGFRPGGCRHTTHPMIDRDQPPPSILTTTEVENGEFTVYGEPRTTFFWLVQGKRGDVEVEPLKSKTVVEGNGPYKWIRPAPLVAARARPDTTPVHVYPTANMRSNNPYGMPFKDPATPVLEPTVTPVLPIRQCGPNNG